MSSFTTLALPAISPASSSTIGSTSLHGAHQVAVKSTSTGRADSNTSSRKLSSFTYVAPLPALVTS